MILGVDIGGTKTLIGAFTDDGQLSESIRFETSKDYKDFLSELKNSFKIFKSTPFKAVVVAVPGRLDRINGTVLSLGNLPWKNEKIAIDIENIVSCKVYIENDSKLAGLYEARQLKPIPDRVLYITVSTGISSGVIYKGKLDEAMLDSESGQMLLPNSEGKLQPWEKFASGKAIFNKYGKKAAEINSQSDWREISKSLSIGVIDLCAVIEPDVVIIGGGVGSHFVKYGTILKDMVNKNLPYIVKRPLLAGAKNAEQAALLGTYEYAKDLLENV